MSPSSALRVRAVIAEDEPLLATALARMLEERWPELEIAAIVHDGDAALEAVVAREPDVTFLDIRMPGRSGLEVAAQLAKSQGPIPELVFVTAYDEYAVAAFEAAAVDYLLKPVSGERLARCILRLQGRLQGRFRFPPQARLSGEPGVRSVSGELSGSSPFIEQGQPGAQSSPSESGNPASLERLLRHLHEGLAARERTRPYLRFLLASVGEVTRQIPVAEVLYFEARDKYVSVVTRNATALVRMPLSELLDALDPEQFAQIHRSTIVRLDAIDTIRRDLAGRTFIYLRETLGGREVKLAVSRQYAARFRGM